MTLRTPQHYFGLALVGAFVVIALKLTAWHETGSVGFLSDAVESVVNVASALLGLWLVSVARRPADADHPYGHTKAEYFSGLAEGFLILLAAGLIVREALAHFEHNVPLDLTASSIGYSGLATLLNFTISLMLLRGAQNLRSLALKAEAKHLQTDVWTTLGVLAGVGLAALTGLPWLDPLIGLAVALYIAREGALLAHTAIHGLMDGALPDTEQRALTEFLLNACPASVAVTHLRTRVAGPLRFISFHLGAPAVWTVGEAHALCDRLEELLTKKFSPCEVLIHVEPLRGPEGSLNS